MAVEASLPKYRYDKRQWGEEELPPPILPPLSLLENGVVQEAADAIYLVDLCNKRFGTVNAVAEIRADFESIAKNRLKSGLFGKLSGRVLENDPKVSASS